MVRILRNISFHFQISRLLGTLQGCRSELRNARSVPSYSPSAAILPGTRIREK